MAYYIMLMMNGNGRESCIDASNHVYIAVGITTIITYTTRSCDGAPGKYFRIVPLLATFICHPFFHMTKRNIGYRKQLQGGLLCRVSLNQCL